MRKVYTSAVVIIPPKSKWQPIQQIREKYDRNINRWMPHITLLYPFRPKVKYNEVESKFQKKCEKYKPFTIYLNRFKFFQHIHQNFTIWLNPEPNNPIINLQAELLKIVPDCDDVNKYKKGFNPHLSIGQIKGKNQLLKIIEILQKSWKELEFIVSEIFFIARENNKNSAFQIEKAINFKS